MKNKGRIWILSGLLLIAAAFFLTGYNIYDEYRAKCSARQALDELQITEQGEKEQADEPETPDYILNPDMEMPVQRMDGVEYIGVLQIPSLNLELPVISSLSYPNLKIAPCRFEGSAYKDDLIIAAHNYVSFFGNLGKLQVGDPVIFEDVDGNEFVYEVAELEVLQAAAVEEMMSGEWDLTLFTCTLSGQSRTTIRCLRVNI
ncbi:MAG: sortase [Bariatricus sp.]